VSGTGNAAAILAPRIAGKGESDLRDAVPLWPVESSHLDAVVRVNPLGVGEPDVVLSESVLIEYRFQPFFGHI
jgi:hypothetical protein